VLPDSYGGCGDAVVAGILSATNGGQRAHTGTPSLLRRARVVKECDLTRVVDIRHLSVGEEGSIGIHLSILM